MKEKIDAPQATKETICLECQHKNCERCTPIGKRSKRNSIRDGRFDTKEDCCKTRFGETGCPQSLRIERAKELAEHDNTLKNEILLDLKNDFFKYIHPDSDAGKVMKTLIKHRITEQP